MTSPAEETDRYRAFLEGLDSPTDGLREEVALRVGPWGFFYRHNGPQRVNAVGLDDDSRVVNRSGGAWYELLTTDGVDAAGALRRLVWLLGRAAPVRAGQAVEAGAEGLIDDPALEVDGDRAVLEAWISYPPETMSPVRVRVEAARGESASIESTPWRSC